MGQKPKPAGVLARFFRARASGATLRQAAAAAGVSRTAGRYWLAQSGGVRPCVRRPRPALRLSLDEGESVSRGLAQKMTLTRSPASWAARCPRSRGRWPVTLGPTATGLLVRTVWP
jgi:hypothetical protein